MTSEEKIIIDTLVSMSKALAKIASEMTAIKEMMSSKSRRELKESRKMKYIQEHQMLGENSYDVFSKNFKPQKHNVQQLTKEGAAEQIKAIRKGEFID